MELKSRPNKDNNEDLSLPTQSGRPSSKSGLKLQIPDNTYRGKGNGRTWGKTENVKSNRPSDETLGEQVPFSKERIFIKDKSDE